MSTRERNEHSRWLSEQGRAATRSVCLLGVLLMGTAWTGCSRKLTITQEDYINTAMFAGRSGTTQRGEPLELNIVCVYPGDLKEEANDRLDPESEITSDVWYEDRPVPGDKEDTEDRETRFWLPKKQIFLLTDDKKFFGTRIGGRLRGALIDKKKDIRKEFKFDAGLHDKKSVIYVFPKFIGPDGRVLPIRPAKLHPPGAYTDDLHVKIGVDAGREYYGQYIKNETPRKLHGREKEEE